MKESPRFETLPLGLLLALAGGSLDCYTYLNRGQVFATAETGNLVMMGAWCSPRSWPACPLPGPTWPLWARAGCAWAASPAAIPSAPLGSECVKNSWSAGYFYKSAILISE